jgi:hypothetical protein
MPKLKKDSHLNLVGIADVRATAILPSNCRNQKFGMRAQVDSPVVKL